jgi:hypothetical protein
MLSTAPEGNEPRGGDNVRLYVWDRDSNTAKRIGNAAVMTQTRYGGGIDRLDLRGGADRSTITHGCSETDEKAPFLWLDRHRLLVVTLADGQVSTLIDQYGRAFRVAAMDERRLRDASVPTGRAVGSGAAREPRDMTNGAILKIVDTDTHAATTVTTVPAYPFRGICCSGLYDLESVSRSGRSQYVHLTPDVVTRLSPARHANRIHCPLVLAYDWSGQAATGTKDAAYMCLGKCRTCQSEATIRNKST